MKLLLKPLPPFRLIPLVVLAACVVPILSQHAAHHSTLVSAERTEVKNIFWQPDEVIQGSPVLISVELSVSLWLSMVC